jgi:signal transduction histidine kinase
MPGGHLDGEHGESAATAWPRNPVRLPTKRQVSVAVAAAAAVCAVVSALLLLTGSPLISIARELGDTFWAAASALFLGAGVLRVSRWRILGDSRSSLMGVALVVIGSVVIPLPALLSLVAGSGGPLAAALMRTLATLAVVTLVVVGLSDRAASTARRPAVTTAWIILANLIAMLAVCLAARERPDLFAVSPVTTALASLAPAAAWLLTGLYAFSLDRDVLWARRAAPLITCMAAVEVVHASAVLQPAPWAPAAGALAVTVAGISGYCALSDLADATAIQSANLAGVTDALSRARRVVSGHEEWRQEMRHDVRNALSGLRAALLILDRNDGRLDPDTVTNLRCAALDELGHLEHLIESPTAKSVVDFDVARVVRAVVEPRRATGLEVSCDVPALHAQGCPEDLATVLGNLLVNAQRHAPGAPVTVSADVRAGRVEIQVADRGPGLCEDQVARLFDRGFRGAASAGSGIGLSVARNLMRRQGGELRPLSYSDGTVFEVSLPATQPRSAVLPSQRSTGRLVMDPRQPT